MYKSYETSSTKINPHKFIINNYIFQFKEAYYEIENLQMFNFTMLVFFLKSNVLFLSYISTHLFIQHILKVFNVFPIRDLFPN